MHFPKYVYKAGTGKKMNDNGLHTAESVLVASAEELTALGEGWHESPVDVGIKPAAPAKTVVAETMLSAISPKPEPEPGSAADAQTAANKTPVVEHIHAPKKVK